MLFAGTALLLIVPRITSNHVSMPSGTRILCPYQDWPNVQSTLAKTWNNQVTTLLTVSRYPGLKMKVRIRICNHPRGRVNTCAVDAPYASVGNVERYHQSKCQFSKSHLALADASQGQGYQILLFASTATLLRSGDDVAKMIRGMARDFILIPFSYQRKTFKGWPKMYRRNEGGLLGLGRIMIPLKTDSRLA